MSYPHVEVLMLQGNVGLLDGREMIRMNNIAVGYFPSDSPEIGLYPPPFPDQQAPTEVPLEPELNSEMNS